MNVNIFKLEQYLSRYEFSAPYLLCCSDAESFNVHEIIAMANPQEQELWKNLKLGYTEVSGSPVLRGQIMSSLYPRLQANQIFCFAGAEEGIFCALQAICEPKDHVIVLTPCYQSLIEVPRMAGADISDVPLREENEWRIDLKEIRQHIKSNTKCIIINFPHNPTGQVITQEELMELIALCDQHDLWLFSDEVYRLLGRPKQPWAMPAAEIYPKALSLGVMSKAFGMAGLRVGWIACQDRELIKKIEYIKHYTSICNSAPAEIISLITLKNKDLILERNNKIVSDNLILIENFVEEYQSLFSWIKPQGGCVGFMKYKGSELIDDFSKRLVNEAGVLLMPASIYDYQSNHFRIGFGRKSMPESLEKLKEFLRT